MNTSNAFGGEAEISARVGAIFVDRCAECHLEGEREGGLSLSERDMALIPADSGRVPIVPNDSQASELLARLTTTDADSRMPPDGERLTTHEIETIVDWIQSGAKWFPTTATPQHWAWSVPQPPELPTTPSDHAQWIRNPIDAFVLRKQRQHQLTPSPPADPARLLRRVYLDLIGLPPKPDQLAAWLDDPSETAYQATVDRLLASPEFGPKWARPWLDQARYSDSNGYQADQLRDMWAYRDWVINAMNDGMPFDQFTIEQLAGDLLDHPTVDQQIATGFHRGTTCNVEAGVDPESNRVDQVIDRVNTTATVWLGATLECAQCHNHKYDPFSQQDYYQFFAFFNNTPVEVKLESGVQFNFWGPTLELPQRDSVKQRHQQLTQQLAEIKASLASYRSTQDNTYETWLSAPTLPKDDQIPAKIRNAFKVPKDERSAAQNKSLREYFERSDKAVAEIQQRRTNCQTALDALEPNTTLVMVEQPESRQTSILLRGQYQTPGPSVIADTPASLGGLPSDVPRNRLSLARWIVNPKNPLTARVVVNRWWQEIFGRGLVETSEDFGTQGTPPTHPELLDYLATELVRSEWSMKRTLRLIVTSSTYRQSAKTSSALQEQDPNNQLYARGPRSRLAAEAIRDRLAAVSGLLSLNKGGSPVYPPQPKGLWRQTGRNEPVYRVDDGERRFRRGVYVIWRRAAPYPSFINFDAPDRMACVVQRPSTNTPIQALTLMNDEAYMQMAQGFAARVVEHGHEHDNARTEKQIQFAFKLALARVPSDQEVAIVQQLIDEETKRLQADTNAVSDLTANPPPLPCPAPVDELAWAVWCCVANMLLNLDEIITKG